MSSSSHPSQQRITASAISQAAFIAVEALLVLQAPSYAFQSEPANALSLPTWIIHVSSVLEWMMAMYLVWMYAEATENPGWKKLAYGMIPLLGGAFSACTWHFFYNAPELAWLVTLQSSLTTIGNCTLWWGAYQVFKTSKAKEESESSKQEN